MATVFAVVLFSVSYQGVGSSNSRQQTDTTTATPQSTISGRFLQFLKLVQTEHEKTV